MDTIDLHILNTIAHTEAYQYLEKCCVSRRWIEQTLHSRPFRSHDELVKKAAEIWFENCGEDDYIEAFAGHPQIGDVKSLQKKFEHTQTWASNEQSAVSLANHNVIEALATANNEYLKKYGYIFIVSASGKTAGEMLTILEQRLLNDIADELLVAANEQHKITVIRLSKLLKDFELPEWSQLTTHVLDTAAGHPASMVPISLRENKDGRWRIISSGVTDMDGRIKDILAPGKRLELKNYQMVFDTGYYFNANKTTGFYPAVSILFEVKDNKHYHVPLLLNPYGYSTYRGS